MPGRQTGGFKSLKARRGVLSGATLLGDDRGSSLGDQVQIELLVRSNLHRGLPLPFKRNFNGLDLSQDLEVGVVAAVDQLNSPFLGAVQVAFPLGPHPGVAQI